MFASLKEAFQDADYMSFRPDLANLLGNTYPNLVPTNDAAADYAAANKTDINALTKEVVNGQFLSGGYDIASRFKPIVPRALRDRQAICQGATIDQAIAMAKPGENIRCGWIYKNNTGPNIPPITDTGFLGDANSPLGLLGNVPPGTYYPDPAAAKKQKLVDLCAKMTSCSMLDSSAFAGKCAWSQEAGRAVPIEQGHARGNPLYPNDPLLMQGVNSATIIRTPAQCPPPAPPAPIPLFNEDGTPNPAAALGTGGSVYTDECPSGADANTTTPISQRCLKERLIAAKCTDQGTLYAALSAARNPNDLLADISITPAFKRYQQIASVPLNREQLKDGQITAAAALQNFTGLFTAATDTSNEETSFGYAARELCNKSKMLDQFDFCTEVSDSQVPPFSLDCMQKEFKKVGGIPNGLKYPKQADTTSSQYPNWGAYKAYVALLAQQARSTDIRIQEAALRDLLGISRESLLPRSIVPIVDGYEIYVNRWRSNDDTIFMGRMFMDATPGMPLINNAAQIPALMGGSDSSMTIITNLKPPSDLNIGFDIQGGWTNIIRGNINKDPIRNNECKVITRQNDNFLYLYYGQTAGNAAALRVNYYLCNQAARNIIPGSWLKLTQELKAPMLSFEVNGSNVMSEYRQPENFRSMGTYTPIDIPTNIQDAPNGKKFMSITSTGHFWQVNKLINIRAWNSLTFCFRIDGNRAANVEGLFAYRFTQLGLGLTENNSITAFLPDNTRATFANTVGDWYVCYISKQSGEGYSDNKYTIAIYPYDMVVRGVTLSEPSHVYTKTFYRNVPIASSIESNGLFQFGNDTVSQVSARFSLAWFHVFDYNLTANDLKTDATNGWKRAWHTT